ncbi:hypothetical protein LTR84_004581 [Exophiala bonariae]|uniref:Zn(2)-C6 fungal-type domain-containing protein n=1 Tax=Exophiala bonariae TaxID=1690606 RepID=A0AAV9NMA9_9EURO|nr:hypothetical protein LTR84_004581 [Exophiala bonariae]
MSGRPRKACSTCKLQKIRCTGEKPKCKRCVRLEHSCSYEARSTVPRKAQQTPPSLDPYYGQTNLPALTHNSNRTHVNTVGQGIYLGIPRPLIKELIEIYYENVCNSTLLLHKTSFLESVSKGTVVPHTLLSVCAWGANFYKDSNGSATLKAGGFMTEWAQQAGKLAFQEIENFSNDLVVTFLNLTLFWHSQGSWKVSSLYKANAFHLLCILGIGNSQQQKIQAFDVEVQRRLFWSWYIMHCHNTESRGVLDTVGDLMSLPLPWPEEDFGLGTLTSPTTTLASSEGSTSVFAEMSKIMTLWSQAVNLIKTPETSLSAGRVTAILTLDDKVALWWRNLPSTLKLEADSLATVPGAPLPLLLLTNLIYHQTLCVLHASIVPLFCWTAGDDAWSLTRQSSAQVAYEHACTVSALIRAALASSTKISAMPTFVAYAAYGGCAILMPFMWSTNLSLRYQAQANVRTNVRMIHGMAEYWKFAKLLTVHVNCLYNIHKRNPPTLDNEPKYIDVGELTSFKIEALYARVSILTFLGVLQKGSSSFADPGQETTDLGIEPSVAEGNDLMGGPVGDDLDGPVETSQQKVLPTISTQPSVKRNDLPDLMQSQQWNLLPPSGPGIDMFSPSFTLSNLEALADSSATDVMQSDFDLEFVDIDGWDYGTMNLSPWLGVAEGT